MEVIKIQAVHRVVLLIAKLIGMNAFVPAEHLYRLTKREIVRLLDNLARGIGYDTVVAQMVGLVKS
ncbi:hypothetical protein M2132_000512 [Dysgonomonas sp. PH5-45]|uniref:hypothetical protein n=1 Tax=Dysgonomonas sp. PH5-45 TaxID=1742396 RepID=UPI0024766367|nr:hypothetical protein [Dysgonomonas sp. PH5-45]MDH6354185.1 hypothetical protein [Dysgonomonas sp. PH5-45]